MHNNQTGRVYKETIKFVGFYILILLVSNAKMVEGVSPFAFALVFAVGFIFPRAYYILPAYLLATLTLQFNFIQFVMSFCTVSFCLLNMILSERANSPVRQIVLFLTAVLSQAPAILCLWQYSSLIISFVSLLLGLVLVYLYSIFFVGLSARGVQTTFAIDENIGFAMLVLPMLLGFYGVQVLGISIHAVVFSFGVLAVAYAKGGVFSLAYGVIAGLGVAFSGAVLTPLAYYCSIAVVVMMGGRKSKYLSFCLVLISDLILGNFFNANPNYGLFSFLGILIGCVAFVVVPTKIYNRAYEYFSSETVCFSNSYLIEQDRRYIQSKLSSIAKIFYQMNDVYKKMVLGEMDKDEVAQVLVDDVAIKTCKDCEKKRQCYRENEHRTRSQLLSVVECGIQKGRVSLVDVPSGLSTCSKINALMAKINQNIFQYRQYEGLVAREDRNKIAVGNQFRGVGEILEQMNISLGRGKRVDESEERAMIEEFLYNNIIVRECYILEDDNGLQKAVVILKNAGYKKQDILYVSDKFFKTRTRIVESKYSDVSGWLVLTIKKAPLYDLLFGCATKGKNDSKINGDRYAYSVLGENRVLVGIADGKGSGEEAEKISTLSIGLIEDFYRAGFQSDIIMQNVNRILAVSNRENFSAIDVCVIDSSNGDVDIVKLGSPPTLIKHKGKIKVVETENLPMGVIKELPQTQVKYHLSSGDIMVMVSDGVMDSFGDINEFGGFVNNCNLINMQLFAENILEEAIARNKGRIVDDMTVVAIRAIYNR